MMHGSAIQPGDASGGPSQTRMRLFCVLTHQGRFTLPRSSATPTATHVHVVLTLHVSVNTACSVFAADRRAARQAPAEVPRREAARRFPAAATARANPAALSARSVFHSRHLAAFGNCDYFLRVSASTTVPLPVHCQSSTRVPAP